MYVNNDIGVSAESGVCCPGKTAPLQMLVKLTVLFVWGWLAIAELVLPLINSIHCGGRAVCTTTLLCSSWVFASRRWTGEFE